jgi:mannitol/fructose-specific phosphotransferase system IIA component (Ntr-type)
MSVFGFEIDPALITIIEGRVSKRDALDQLIGVMSHSAHITDPDAFQRAVHERERSMSTGIGDGVAIPHVRLAGLTEIIVGIGVAPHGIDYTTLDRKPVYLMILLATPEGADRDYLRKLAQIMAALRSDDDLVPRLATCHTSPQIAALLNTPQATDELRDG